MTSTPPPAPSPAAPASLLPPTASPGTKKAPLMGPVRTNLEAFGVAILAAVLLKWFCLEAFQIPTSSMQPTLMGDTPAGVYDRIVVDKFLPLLRDPKRWDVTVFAYPLQKNQNYVKRIGGMPGDRLRIAGGNLYQVIDGQDGKRSYRVERKPDDLQANMWKNVLPLRSAIRGQSRLLGNTLNGAPGRAFREDDAAITVTLESSRAMLYFRDPDDGGVLDRVWDGYPEAVAREIRENNRFDSPAEIVPDVRITTNVTPSGSVDELALEIDVVRPGHDRLVFALVVKGEQATLQVRQKDSQQVVAQSPAFPCTLPRGSTTELSFAHVDDQLIAWRDGDELQRFATDEFAVRDGCVLATVAKATKEGIPYVGLPSPADAPDKLSLPLDQKVTPQLAAAGSGELRITDLRIDRDQHYVQDQAPDVIEVPEGHYYMLGDNTRQSVDSRGWTAITVGVDADGNIVPPDTPGARVVRGNKRPMPLDKPPDRDETPIPILGKDRIVMIDEYGEILSLKGKVGPDWPARVSFLKPGGVDARDEWVAPEATNARGISFVPRGDIRGRALLIFYPCRPFAWLTFNNWPGRFGFVR